MPHGFQHQDQLLNYAVPKTAATPQHGQKSDKKAVPPREPRSFQPRPGH